MLLENIPGRLEVLLKSVMQQIERLHSVTAFSEQDRVSILIHVMMMCVTDTDIDCGDL